MYRRATFIHSANDELDPSEIELNERRLFHRGIKGAREERLVFGAADLPEQLSNALKELKELHIRWSPETSPGSISPFLSRLTPGFHVHYAASNEQDSSLLCPALKQAFSNDLKCISPEASFSRSPNSSDQSNPSLQYYSLLPSLSQLVTFVQQKICSQLDQQCIHDAQLLQMVDYLDLDYESTGQKLTLTAFWSKPPAAVFNIKGQRIANHKWPLDIIAAVDTKVEVGILSYVQPDDPVDLQVEGFITMVGQDTNPKAAQFSFPSRHRILPRAQASRQGYTSQFQKPTGLHPTMQITFPSTAAVEPPTNKADYSQCSLHAYLTLPSSIFADEYAYTAKDPLFEQSHNLRSIRSISGELDLEAPDYVVDRWGSTMLLELATPTANQASAPDAPWNVTIPLHLRYQPPSEGGLDRIHVPWPLVFWACSVDEGIKLSNNPFDRVGLGYDKSFDPTTVFYHLKPVPLPDNEGRLVETIIVPVLDTSRVGGDAIIERTTLTIILLGFGWVLWKLWPGLSQKSISKKSIRSKKRTTGKVTELKDEVKVGKKEKEDKEEKIEKKEDVEKIDDKVEEKTVEVKEQIKEEKEKEKKKKQKKKKQ